MASNPKNYLYFNVLKLNIISGNNCIYNIPDHVL